MILYNGNSANWLSESQTWKAVIPSYIFSQEIKSIVMKTLNQLPEQTKKVFIMNRFENKSGKEIDPNSGHLGQRGRLSHEQGP